MIGEVRKILTQYYDSARGKMDFKARPALIIAQADPLDYVALPVSRVSRRENLHPIYDIEITPDQYPDLNLPFVSYVRTHKQIVVHYMEIGAVYGNMKTSYEELYLMILEKREAFSREVTDQALG